MVSPKKFWLIFCLLLLAGQARAQDPVISFSMLNDDEPMLIGRYVMYWDADQETTDLDVLQGLHDQKFGRSTQDLPGRGFIKNSVWFRIAVDNPGSATEVLYLDSRYALLDSVTLFQKNAQGVYVGEVQGDNQPERRVKPKYRIPSFKLQATPGRNVYYVKMQAKGSSVIALYLATPEAERQFQMKDIAVLALMFGVMLTLLLYNLFLSLSFRSITYVFYTVFVTSMTVTELSMQGIWPMILPGPAGAWANNTGFLISGCITFFTAGLVTMNFLNMREHMKVGWYVFIGFLAFSGVMIPLAFVTPYNIHVKVMSSMFLFGSVMMIMASLIAVGRGYRPAFAYSFAWGFMIASNILLALTYEGVSHIPMIVQWGNFPGVACEGILMSLALGDRVNFIRAKADRTIHELNEELQKHLVQVEALVAERTETIRTIIDNVASGFLMVSREGTIVPGFTRSCHQLLGQDLREGQNFLAILGVKPAVSKKFRMALEQIFDDQMPLEVTLAQLPTYVLSHGKYVHVEAAGIRNKDGQLQHLLLTLTDATELRKRKIEAQRNRSLLKILRDIEGFRQFVAYSFEAVQKLKTLRTVKASRETQFILHTLKGNCLVFQLPEIARFLHQLEEQTSVSSTEIAALEEQFKKYLTRHASLLRTVWGPISHEKRVTDAQLEALQELARTRFAPPLRLEIEQWVQDVSAKPVLSILHSLLNDARVVARKVNKDVEFRVLDRNTRIQSESEEALIEQLIHVVRNAIVHGIEDDREAVQKPRQGFICLDFREVADGLAISCSDDGRGFDRKVWEAEWIARGLPVEGDISRLSLVQLVSEISRGGFSTQKTASLLAGRGVGIEALFAAVNQCQGTLDIVSEPGKGSRFEIFIPRPHSLRSVS
ncbi:MAG TPA: 7TM diverse intracellular signaling domain-containing protein [Oligoflexus sp.]|uniref:7TM diverse intracellular signaling domain-containing protein n=1 Tax=Oligoflexus sp. TaxID=1971216 RepID=UPI002D61EE1E|nr:7TM diverse intracellular signaling domain-containing protein [Oligoflexus sp.]HYX34168.1 7TM diverse intracellular signaling domain-containing protein [Oligoflexus sp.]